MRTRNLLMMITVCLALAAGSESSAQGTSSARLLATAAQAGSNWARVSGSWKAWQTRRRPVARSSGPA